MQWVNIFALWCRREDALSLRPSLPVQMPGAMPFEGRAAPSLARHSDRKKGQSPVDLGSSGQRVSAAAVVQPPNVTDSTQS